MKKILFVGLLMPLFALAQESAGVRFEEGSSWPAILEKAKAENKYIFVDCYTTWCGPCKMMKNVVFPQAEAGAYFNEKFVSIGVQLDSTQRDNDTVKRWYSKAHDLIVGYNVQAYPTFLIFSPDGKALTRVVGGNEKAADFIARVKEAMTPEKQYYTLLERYDHGERDTAFLRKMTLAAVDAYDRPTSAKASKDYLSRQSNLLTKGNLEFIGLTTASSNDPGFQVLLRHPVQADAVLGAGKAEQKVEFIILKEEVYPAFHSKSGPDWGMVTKRLQAKYPGLADELLLKAKAGWYESKGDWANFLPVVTSYMQKYGRHASQDDCNNFAFDVFLHCSDMNCVSMALDWSKKSLENNPNAGFMDTYANILYKLGRKEEAIAAEQKSVALAGGEQEKAGYRETLEKMQKGEKTWL